MPNAVYALYAAREFYSIEAVEVLVNSNCKFGTKSHERLLDDITKFKIYYVNKLALAIFDYTAMVVFGEMRHGRSQSSHYNSHVPTSESERSTSYKKALKYNPLSILQAGNILFNSEEVSWSSSFGGKKWGRIAKHGLLRPKLADNIFCDMCFSLSHNTNPYFDKFQSNIFSIEDSSAYKNFLDFKFEMRDPNELFRYNYNYLGFRLRQLIQRAINLGFVQNISLYRNNYADYAEDYILDYKPIIWGSEILPSEIIDKQKEDQNVQEEESEDNEDEEGDTDESEYEHYKFFYESYSNNQALNRVPNNVAVS